MSDVVLKLVLSAVAVVAALIMTYVSQKYLSKSEREILQSVIETAVAAAEQIYKGQSGAGELKKAHVLTLLHEKGILKSPMTAEVTQEIDDMIEAAVYELNHK
jgi:uncharacterized protein (UPF0333 family)